MTFAALHVTLLCFFNRLSVCVGYRWSNICIFAGYYIQTQSKNIAGWFFERHK